MSEPVRTAGCPSLVEVLRFCAEARWHSLHACASSPPTAGTVGSLATASLTAAIVVRSRRRLHPGEAAATADPDGLPRLARVWLEIGFQHLGLAEQRILLEATAEAAGHGMAFLQSLRSAALVLDPGCDGWLPTFRISDAQVLVVRLQAQLQLSRALAAGRVADRMIVVLGMHRSGTSALAGMLCVAGYDPPEDQMPADANNPKGYWESMGLYGLNDQLLDQLGSSWQGCHPLPAGWENQDPAVRWRDQLLDHFGRVFAGSACPVIKDPRFCILLPGLAPWLESDRLQCSVLIPVRHPLEVASSLQTRDGIGITACIQLWLAHLFAAERLTRRYRRCLISFEQLLARPSVVLDRVTSMVGSSHAAQFSEASEFVDAGLRHQDASRLLRSPIDLSPPASTALRIAESLYDILTSSSEDDQALWARVDRLHSHWLTIPIAQLLAPTAQLEAPASNAGVATEEASLPS